MCHGLSARTSSHRSCHLCDGVGRGPDAPVLVRILPPSTPRRCARLLAPRVARCPSAPPRLAEAVLLQQARTAVPPAYPSLGAGASQAISAAEGTAARPPAQPGGAVLQRAAVAAAAAGSARCCEVQEAVLARALPDPGLALPELVRCRFELAGASVPQVVSPLRPVASRSAPAEQLCQPRRRRRAVFGAPSESAPKER